MTKKINTKLIKLIKYYSLINHNLIYNNHAINRYKKDGIYSRGNLGENLKKLKTAISNIKNCDLKKNSTNLVFADGNPKAKIMIVGEGPGDNEDKEGFPFVGRAGALLDKMLTAIDLNRKNVYISKHSLDNPTYNWPYDYCSLIETAKVNTKVGFRPDLDKEYADAEGSSDKAEKDLKNAIETLAKNAVNLDKK